MNRFILKYAYPITAVILVIFAWVIYRRIAQGWSETITLAVAAVIVWAVGAPTFIYLWPRLTVYGFKRAIVKRGFGGGPIPVNTLYAEPSISSALPTGSLMGTGTDDVLYIAGRYYSLQFTDPSSSTNFAYVGKRATGTKAGDYVLSEPGWKGTVPGGMTQISAPRNSVLVIGRVFVDGASDQPTAYALAQQIRLASLNS